VDKSSVLWYTKNSQINSTGVSRMSIFVKVAALLLVVISVLVSSNRAMASEGINPLGIGPRTDIVNLTSRNNDKLKEVQKAFYDRGFDVTVSGKLGRETINAFVQLQRALKEPITGRLTSGQWKKLLAESPPTSWGALAVSTDGTHAEAHSQQTRALAEQIALRNCLSKTKSDCWVRSAPNYYWIVSGWCRLGNRTTVFLRIDGISSDKAFAKANKAAIKDGFDPYNGKDCFQAVAVHAMFGYEHTLTEREGFEVEHQADGQLVDVPN